MPGIIICANFGSENVRGLGYTGGVKFWSLQLKWLVTLTFYNNNRVLIVVCTVRAAVIAVQSAVCSVS